MDTRRVLTVADPNCQIVVFTRPDGTAQAIITKSEDGERPTTIEIAKPPKGQRRVVARLPDGSVEVYNDDE